MWHIQVSRIGNANFKEIEDTRGPRQGGINKIGEAPIKGASFIVVKTKLWESCPKIAPHRREDTGANGLDGSEAEEDRQEEIIRQRVHDASSCAIMVFHHSIQNDV